MSRNLILCGMANDYFFPAVDNVENVFAKQNSKLTMFLAKTVRELHIPALPLFYGEWKKHLRDFDKVVIFDLGYQPGMEKYIVKKNPNAKVFYYIWNSIDNNRKLMKMNAFSYKDRIFSTDPQDCKKYKLNFLNIFYSKLWTENVSNAANKEQNEGFALWVGHNKNRADWLVHLAEVLNDVGKKVDFRISGIDESNPYHLTEDMDYFEYCKLACGADLLIDINQQGQAALTMRVMESIFFQKKLITNNKSVVNYLFFDENNILVMDSMNLELETIKEFLAKPFHKYDMDTINSYDVQEWQSHFV